MSVLWISVFLCARLVSVSGLDSYAFPENFIFGAATASYQIEGAWNTDDKGENIWDRLTHQRPYIIRDGSNGDIACNSYYKFKEDVQLLTNLKVKFYRFSLSWARILPNGLCNSVNQNGIDYYNNIINELIENDIMPMITMYHWDLPQSLQDIGGWANPKIVDYFTEFARVVFDNFADRVPYWITFNEPNPICRDGYGDNYYAPALGSNGLAEYYCAYHLLKAHTSVYHLFNDKYRNVLNGRIGLVMDMAFYYPHSDSAESLQAQENALQFTIGLYLHPIYHPNGDYPEIVKVRIAERSEREGFTKSRLPSFTSEEIDYIRASADFLGVNHYTSYVAQHQDEPMVSEPKFEYDRGFYQYQSESWNKTASDWFRVVPEGFKDLLIWIASEYNNPEIIITENGFSDAGELVDDGRVSYYRDYLSAMLEAVYEHNVNVTGYTAWSLLDNFEWTGGYLERFGMYKVDFDDDDRPRTEKRSAQFYREVIARRCVVGKQNCE